MEFGKVKDITNIKFQLPEDASGTSKLLRGVASSSHTFKVYTGCPVWANKNWVGEIYPRRAKDKDFLKYYAQQFNTIELNTTHYRIPDETTIEKWKKQIPPHFKFSPKFPKIISHELLLKGDPTAVTLNFYAMMTKLGENLGTSFLQLPPYFGIRYFSRLKDFLQILPKGFHLAIEFRHPDWFKGNNFEKIASVLEQYQVGTVLTDVAGRRDVLHLRLTTPSVMLRFVGHYLRPTDYQRVDDWVQRFQKWQQEGLQEIYFFAHQPDNNLSPRLAAYFIQQMNKHGKSGLIPPKFLPKVVQGNLF